MISTLLLVGCGNMGHAMLKGWLAVPNRPVIHVVEPNRDQRDRASAAGAHAVATRGELPADLRPDLVVVALKPQVFGAVLPDYATYAGAGAAVLSIAGGIRIQRIEGMLPAGVAVLRCMPNTPAAIGAGVLALCANPHATPTQVAGVRHLLEPCGRVFDIADEDWMDAVTAVSGSGPAYLFHFIEALTAAAVSVGLPADLAGPMATETVLGAARLATDGTEPPATLRRNVTSPNGTTAAALDVLMADDALTDLVRRAVVAARDRSVALQST